jgi:hypothetical protein
MMIIRAVCGAALLLAFTGAAQAQSAVQLGVTGGVSISNFTGDDVDETDSRTSGYFGGVLVWQPAGMLGFETGVSFVPKGAKASDEGDEFEIKLAQIEVPLLLRLALTPAGRSIRPVLTVGGAVAFKSSCDVEVSSGGLSQELDCDEFFKLLNDDSGIEAETQSVDFGLVAGFAVDVPVGERAVVSPHVRYTRGLRDVIEFDGESLAAKNTNVQVGVAVRVRR